MSGNKIKILAVLLLIVAGFAMAPNASASKELRITDYNLNILQNHAVWVSYGDGYLMQWPSLLDASCQKQKMIGSISAVSVDDNQCTIKFYGECVSLVKSLAKSNVVTYNWIQGNHVVWSGELGNPIAPGTAIATFNSIGKYEPGHVAIFRSYTYNMLSGRINGFWVWDQNYLPELRGVVAWHWIPMKTTTSRTEATNANNYYVVRVP